MTKVLQHTRTNQNVLNALRNESVRRLIKHLKIHSVETYAHSLNVAAISAYIANQMSVSEVDKKTIVIGALLHDVGKMSVPKKILDKPKKLNPKEAAGMAMHSQISYLMAKNFFNKQIQEICLYHHEKLDGSGYPDGIKKIPLFCQIVTVADMYESMVASRVYKKPVTHEEAMIELEKEKLQGRINSEVVEIIRISNLLKQ